MRLHAFVIQLVAEKVLTLNYVLMLTSALMNIPIAEKNPMAAKVGGSILSSAKNHIVFNAKRVKGMVLGGE